jgi:hypothetical protein
MSSKPNLSRETVPLSARKVDDMFANICGTENISKIKRFFRKLHENVNNFNGK